MRKKKQNLCTTNSKGVSNDTLYYENDLSGVALLLFPQIGHPSSRKLQGKG